MPLMVVDPVLVDTPSEGLELWEFPDNPSGALLFRVTHLHWPRPPDFVTTMLARREKPKGEAATTCIRHAVNVDVFLLGRGWSPVLEMYEGAPSRFFGDAAVAFRTAEALRLARHILETAK